MMKIKLHPFSALFCVILSMFAECLSQDYWVPLPSPTTKRLNKVCFVDSITGWAVGDSGTIIHTTTGGQSWEKQQSGISSEIFDIFMLTNNLGWAISPVFDNPNFESLFLTTTDGGNNWTRKRISEKWLYAVAFTDSMNGWLVGENGAILGSNDGGLNWFEATIDTNIHPQFELNVVKFYSSQYGYAFGGRYDITGMTWRTTNGGQSWHPMYAGAEPLWGVHFFDSLNVLCVGGDFDFGSGMIRTKNGGSTWNYTYLGIWGKASALEFRTPAEAWSPLGFARTYMFSPDSGQTWQDYPTPGNSEINDVTFPDSLHGYMVGKDGVILKYNSSPVAVREEYKPSVPSTVKLFQNYPNPFNPSTIIGYELTEYAVVTLIVYDIAGKEVKKITIGGQEPGAHSVEFKAEGLASGAYVYELATSNIHGKSAQARRMMLLK